MSIEQVRKRVSGGGFQPFVIRTSDGREYKVPHPEFILVAKTLVVVVGPDGDPDTIDPLHIVSLKDLNTRGKIGKKAA